MILTNSLADPWRCAAPSKIVLGHVICGATSVTQPVETSSSERITAI